MVIIETVLYLCTPKLPYVTVNSVAQGTLTFVGQNIGARKYTRLKKSIKTNYFVAIITGVIISAILFSLRNPISMLYMNSQASNAQAVLGVVQKRFFISIIPYFLVGMQDVGSNVLKGLDKSFLSMITSFIGACVSRVVWISTVFRIYRTIESVYLIMPISWFLTTLSLYLFVLREIKKLPDGGE